MAGAVLERYDERLTLGELESDPAQRGVCGRLDALQLALGAGSGASSRLKQLFATKPAGPPRGLYIYGAVGRGKTMLMDLFFDETQFTPKRRTHFHEFMADVHDRIGDARSEVPGDPIPHVARKIAAEAKLLCFDELHDTDTTQPR